MNERLKRMYETVTGSFSPHASPSDVTTKSEQHTETRCQSISEDIPGFKAEQTVIFISCAEYMSEVFGNFWHEHMLKVKSTGESDHSEQHGAFCRADCNQVSKREKWAYATRRRVDHSYDPPLTELGLETAEHLGKALAAVCAARCKPVTYWYSAPELRCLQTVSAMYAGTGWNKKDCKFGILVNPALCDYYGPADSIPRFIDPRKMAKLKEGKEPTMTVRSSVQVNTREYTKALTKWAPVRSTEGLKEEYEDYQKRFRESVNHIFQRVVQSQESGVTVVILPRKSFFPAIFNFPGQPKKRASRLSYEDLEDYGKETPRLAVAQFEGKPGNMTMTAVKPWMPGLTSRALKLMARVEL